MIVANSLYSNDATSEAIQTARDNVKPMTRTFVAGETIVSSGEVIDILTWEALQELGYTEPKNKILDYFSAGLLTAVLMAFNMLYIRRIRQTTGKKIQDLAIIAVTFLVFLFAAKLIIPNHTILPYLFPLAAFGLTVASLYDYETGLVFSISLSILAAYNESSTIDLAIYYLIPTAIADLHIRPRAPHHHLLYGRFGNRYQRQCPGDCLPLVEFLPGFFRRQLVDWCRIHQWFRLNQPDADIPVYPFSNYRQNYSASTNGPGQTGPSSAAGITY